MNNKEKIICETFNVSDVSQVENFDLIMEAMDKYQNFCTPSEDEFVCTIVDKVFICGIELELYESNFRGWAYDELCNIYLDKVPRRYPHIQHYPNHSLIFDSELWEKADREGWAPEGRPMRAKFKYPNSYLISDDDARTSEVLDSTHVVVIQ